jgi:hypothetical protein
MEPEIIEMAKNYAAENKISVSKLVKNLITEVSKKNIKTDPFLEKLKQQEISPKILALTGILKGKCPEDVDYREAYREHLTEKHGI